MNSFKLFSIFQLVLRFPAKFQHFSFTLIISYVLVWVSFGGESWSRRISFFLHAENLYVFWEWSKLSASYPLLCRASIHYPCKRSTSAPSASILFQGTVDNKFSYKLQTCFCKLKYIIRNGRSKGIFTILN